MDEPIPSRRIGRYVLEALLGRGGMGDVYRARDDVLHRLVALKVLHAEAGPEAAAAVKQVLREARMAAALDHPNVVALFDFGEDQGTPYIVMEHVTGDSLRAALDRGGAPAGERVRWLVDVARALAAAHRAGLVHRDVKPENVMIRDDGVVKVLDFGIARRAAAPPASVRESEGPQRSAESATQATLEGTISGTPGYMAPEQILEGVSDARADQFSWGVLAYEVLSGERPWHGADAVEIHNAMLAAPAPHPDAASLGVSADVVATVLRALDTDPRRRFSSMDELLLALRGPDVQVSARPPKTERVPRSVDPEGPTLQAAISTAQFRARAASPWWRLGAGALVLAVAGAAAAVWVRARKPSAPAASQPPPALEARNRHRLTLDEGCEEFPSFTADGTQVLFDGASGKDFHVFALDVASGTRKPLTSGAGWQFAAQASPDGVHFAYVKMDQGNSSGELARIDGSAPPRFIAAGALRPSFSPDGLAVWAGGDAPTRFDVATLTPGRTLQPPPNVHYRVVLELPDGRVAARATAKNGSTLGVVMYPREGETFEWLYRGDIEDHLTLAPDGRAILLAKIVRGGDELWRVPLDRSEPAVVPWTPAPARGVRFSPGLDHAVWSDCVARSGLLMLSTHGAGFRVGKVEAAVRDWTDAEPSWIPGTRSIVVMSDRDGEKDQLWVLDLSGSAPPRKIVTGLEANGPRVSPDGRHVAFSVANKGLFIVDAEGGAPRQLTSGPGDSSPSFSRDGKRIAFERDDARNREIDEIPIGGGEPTRLRDSGRAPVFSPTRDQLAYLADGTTPTLMDLATKRSHPLAKDGLFQGIIEFSPDGTRAIVTAASALIEIDLAAERVIRRYDPKNDSLAGATYVGSGEIVVSRQAWEGDIWFADGPFR